MDSLSLCLYGSLAVCRTHNASVVYAAAALMCCCVARQMRSAEQVSVAFKLLLAAARSLAGALFAAAAERAAVPTASAASERASVHYHSSDRALPLRARVQCARHCAKAQQRTGPAKGLRQSPVSAEGAHLLRPPPLVALHLSAPVSECVCVP